MKAIVPKTLKGFRDFLPMEAKKRQYAVNTLKQVFESYGFEPLETPALEYEEILLGKYGDEGDKLMYRFEDNGKRKVALRYDQTVPLARVVAQYQNELPMPFKRYQIQNVWRAENTQKGRFREFLQCDADIVGSSSPLSDVEIIMVAAESLRKLGFTNFLISINDRQAFSKLSSEGLVKEEDLPSVLRTLDKLKKIGEEGVRKELEEKGFSKEILKNAKILSSNRIKEIVGILNQNKLASNVIISPTLARGLDYYTGMIFEVEVDGYDVGSIAGGGRYDNLIGMFTNKQIPAVGFAFGFDRLMEAMEELDLFPKDLQTTKVLVTVFSKELIQRSIDCSMLLRSNGVPTELYFDSALQNAKMEKQVKYADQKGIPFVVIIGPKEASKNQVTLRNMKTRQQKTLRQEEIIKILSS